MDIYDAAVDAIRLGYSVIPISGSKKPAVAWKKYQTERLDEHAARGVFAFASQMAVVSGEVSGGLEVLDFDCGGAAFEAFYDLLEEHMSSVLDLIAVEQTPSGGYHLLMRSGAGVGNQKLAMKRHYVDALEPELYGKQYKARVDNEDRMYVDLPLIETRGEGGYFVCSPSAGYQWTKGNLSTVGELSLNQRNAVIELARSLHDVPEDNAQRIALGKTSDQKRPGDDYNERGDLVACLERNGWTHLTTVGDNQQWCRPGKKDGISATWNGEVFYVFSSSCNMDCDRGYSAFSAYTHIEHGGDSEAAARALAEDGYGEQFDAEAFAVGDAMVAAFLERTHAEVEEEAEVGHPLDPGEFPHELLNVPGICSVFQEYVRQRSHKDQPILAMAGSLTLLATLCAGRIRSVIGGHPCLYHLAVADTGAGKNAMLEAIEEVLGHEALQNDGLLAPSEFASGIGMLRYIQRNPKCLFPIDEYGKILASITNNKASDHLKEVATSWLKLYSKAGAAMYKGRAYASESPPTIKEPCINIYGATAPTHLFNAVDSDAIEDGFLSRHLIFFAPEGRAQSLIPSTFRPTVEVLEAAKTWVFSHGSHEMRTLEYSNEAMEAYQSYVERCDERHDSEGKAGRKLLGALWTRAAQKADRLALVRAASRGPSVRRIEIEDWVWAEALVTYVTRKMISELFYRVNDGKWDALKKKILAVLKEQGGCTKTDLARRVAGNTKAKERKEALAELIEAQLVTYDDTLKTPKYKLVTSKRRKKKNG